MALKSFKLGNDNFLLSRSGKTSIAKVVFQKMSPHETFFLLPTAQVETELVNNNENIEFSVVDFPGNYIIKHDSYQHIQSCGALIYVIDAHNPDFESACQTLNEVIKQTS